MHSKLTYYVRWGIVSSRFGWVDWQSVGFVQLIIKVIFVNAKFPRKQILHLCLCFFCLLTCFRGNSTPEITKHDLLEYCLNLSSSSFNKSLVFVLMMFWDCVSRSVDPKYSTRLVRMYFFSSSLFTVAIKSSLVIADTEECGRAAVSEFNDFGVAVSFDVVVAGYCWGRWWFVWDDTLDWKVSFGFVTSVVVGHGLYCVFSGCYLDCVLLLFCQFFWTFENCTPYFVIYLAWQLPGFLPSKSS